MLPFWFLRWGVMVLEEIPKRKSHRPANHIRLSNLIWQNSQIEQCQFLNRSQAEREVGGGISGNADFPSLIDLNFPSWQSVRRG